MKRCEDCLEHKEDVENRFLDDEEHWDDSYQIDLRSECWRDRQ